MFGNKQKPVYVINGFLDSGKTSFFSYTIGQPYFRAKGKTLLILCEEGEVEYTPALLKQTNTVVETFDSAEELTPSAMMALDAKYDPERILIEASGVAEPAGIGCFVSYLPERAPCSRTMYA